MLENEALDDGEIIVQAVMGRSVSRLRRDWLLRFFKVLRRARSVLAVRGRRIMLDTMPHPKISIDGEVVTKTPAVIESADRVIEVVVPKSSKI